MPIKGFRVIPKDVADWDRFFRQVPVEPDPGSVGEEQVENGAITTDKIALNAATNTIIRDSAACSVIGRSANSVGDPADIALGEGEFLVRRGNVVSSSTILEGDIPAAIARDSEVTTVVGSAISTHEAAADPHPGYLTQTEGDARYRELSDAVTYAEITGKPAALALLFSGTGSPETVVTAGIGSTYHRTDGGAGTSFYVKESGAGNTGWVAK